MDLKQNILEALKRYSKRKKHLLDMLVKELVISLPKSKMDWLETNLSPAELSDGTRYFKHGIGISFVSQKGKTISHDFGPNGEINCFRYCDVFEAYKSFIDNNIDEIIFKSSFNKIVSEGLILRIDHLLYVVAD